MSAAEDAGAEAVGTEKTGKSAAFFDLDGTLAATDVIMAYRAYVRERLPFGARLFRTARLLLAAPYLFALECFSRRRFNFAFYRHDRGIEAESYRAFARDTFAPFIRSSIFPGALAELEKQKSEGRAVVIVSGSPSAIVAPLAEALGAEAIATELVEADGRYTGRIAGEPLAAEEKARVVRELAQERGWDLRECFAYGDSVADLQVLRAVGHPIAANPDRKLREAAAEAGWPVREWRGSS